MIIEPTPRPESALEALGTALRVLARPAFLWVPLVYGLVTALPSLLIPALPPEPHPAATDAEVLAYFEAMLGNLAITFVITIPFGILVGSAIQAAVYRLAAQYLDGEPPRPFGPGFVGLAVRLVLQALVLIGVMAGFIGMLVLLVAVGSAVGMQPLAILVAIVLGLIGTVILSLRLVIASALLLSGAGPLEGIAQAWRATRGRMGLVFRWTVLPTIVIGMAALVIGAVLEALLPTGSDLVVTIAGSVAVGPLSLVASIVIVQLARLLTAGRPAAADPADPDPVDATDATPLQREPGIEGSAS